MPAKLERCVEKLKSEGKTEKSAYAICGAAIKDEATFNVHFTDKLFFDVENKKVVSVRDGVQEYYGAELGLEPRDKKFKIYRAPETIKGIADALISLPVTEGHVPLADAIDSDKLIGEVLDSEVIDAVDENIKSTIKIQNRLKLVDLPKDRQLSLGYFADLVPCELYDFEQVDIVPHHLAVVERGRCGDMCKFTDKKGERDMKKKYDVNAAFLDAEGQINMQQVLELVANLPEVIKKLDIKELAKLVPVLQKVTELAQAGAVESPEGEPEGEMSPADVPAPAAAAEPEDAAPAAEKQKETMDKQPTVAIKDTAEFKDALAAENALFAEVVIKAKNFLDSSYDYAGKTAAQIMRDTLATQYKEQFKDGELATAFKMLKKTTDYSNFGKTNVNMFDELSDKEI